MQFKPRSDFPQCGLQGQQQSRSDTSSHAEEKMGDALSKVEELQQRITDAQAQLQAFTTQCQEATLAAQKPVRLSSRQAWGDEAALQQSVPARDVETAAVLNPSSRHDVTCIWRSVPPNPQARLASLLTPTEWCFKHVTASCNDHISAQ